ncbi:MAG: DALR anticodon-binding domain-containing protein [Streptosporangiaceae bacterium]
MIPGDIGAELASAVTAAIAAGELPAGAGARASTAGTWRPAPPGAGGAPGTYATTLPFAMAEAAGLDAATIAALLAARVRRVSWIAAASVTGGGYLTVAVTAETLAALAVRVAQAGDGCTRSEALRGVLRSAPADADLAAAATWAQAWQQVTDLATGRLAAAAGAQVNFKTGIERPVGARPATPAGLVGSRPEGPHGPGPAGPAGPVAAAVAFAGADAIRYALARTRTGRAGQIDARSAVQHVPGNSFFAVCLAAADATATLRWAGDLGLRRGEPGGFVQGRLSMAPELDLLYGISWLPERAAGAARRCQPHEFARYLEGLAGAYLDCREHCPALPFMGRSAPPDAAGVRARLWLASAAGAALGAGLRLLGIDPPDRM